MSDNGQSLIGRTLDGRYRIERAAARGGMATVYLATDLRLQRVVAVKVMHPDLATDPNFVTRFVRESRAAAALAHPNVVAIHDQGQDERTGAVFIVMERVAGRTLREVMAERGALRPAQALAVMDPVLQALSAAHRAGFVHRDIKPENVLIADDGQVKVADFGLARALVNAESNALTRGVLIGTAAYLSPEQVETGNADARSDIYAAGVMLFEMLTGELPHTAQTPIAIAFQHVHNDVPAPSLRHPGIPSALDALVAKATARDPRLRYQSADSFIHDVRRTREQLDGFVAGGDWQATEVISESQPGVQSKSGSTATSPGLSKDAPLPAAAGQQTLINDLRPPRSRARRTLRVAVALLLVAGAAAGWWLATGNRATVPQLVGQAVAAAEADLVEAGLKPKVVQAFSNTVETGTVISANPPSGSSVDRDSTVTLRVSKGPELISVPELDGRPLAAAKDALVSAGFKIGAVTRAYSKTVAAGRVIASNPVGGNQLRPGATVELTVSDGPAPIKLPQLTGSAAAAEQTLRNLGFTNVVTKSVYSDSVAKSNLVSVNPKPLTTLLPDTLITLTVSKGPKPVTVPSTLGTTKSQAEAALQKLGLLTKITWSNSCGTKKVVNTIVLSQTPDGGAQVPKGTLVSLVLARVCRA